MGRDDKQQILLCILCVCLLEQVPDKWHAAEERHLRYRPVLARDFDASKNNRAAVGDQNLCGRLLRVDLRSRCAQIKSAYRSVLNIENQEDVAVLRNLRCDLER